MMRWSLSNSTSAIPGALALDTVKVTGPAGTVVVSNAQRSFPSSLVIVTLTAFVPAFGGSLPAWLHALTPRTATASVTRKLGNRLVDFSIGDAPPLQCGLWTTRCADPAPHYKRAGQ